MPGGTAARWQRIRFPTLLAGGLLGVSVLLHLRDPHRSGSWGYCPWLTLTGTYCPGCGGLRAVNDLTNGDVAGAASSNLLFVVSLPFIAVWWSRSMLDGWRGVARSASVHRTVVGCALFSVLALGFCVARNTGAGAWLAP